MGAIFSRLGLVIAPCFLQLAAIAPSSRRCARQLLEHKPTRDTLVGKAAVVTGITYGGCGFYTAQALALEAGMAVFLCGRNVDKVRDAGKKITEQAASEGKKKPVLYQILVDLEDLDDVQRASEDIAVILRREHEGELQLLINNAGGLVPTYKLTVQGIEGNVGANFVGPFLLTRELLPHMRLAGNMYPTQPRVVNVSSLGHAAGGGYSSTSLLEAPDRGGAAEGKLVEDKKRDDRKMTFKMGMTDAFIMYCVSKNMQISHARSIAKFERSNGVRALSCHPGSVASNFAAGVHWIVDWYYQGLLWLFQYSPDQGGATALHCALSPALNDEKSAGGRGGYFHATRHEVIPLMPGKDDFDDVFYETTSQMCDEKLSGMVM